MNTAVVSQEQVSVEDHLAAEERSEVRHEYRGGLVDAMSGGTRRGHAVAGNLYGALHQHLRNGPCRVYMSEARVNLTAENDEHFYDPDLVVSGDPADNRPRFVRRPTLLIEVLSERTRRRNRREKLSACRTLDSLQEYVPVEPDRPAVTGFRRAAKRTPQRVRGEPATWSPASLELALPLAAVYAGL